MPKVDCILVGFGLAGCSLSVELLKRHKTIHVFSSSSVPSASRASAGLFNPVTGKYLDRAWLADEVFAWLDEFYRNLEKYLNSEFYHPVGLFRPFTGEEHKKSALAQIEKYALGDLIEVVEDASEFQKFYSAGLGGMMTKKAGWVDVKKMLDLLAVDLSAKGCYTDENFDYSQLEINSDSVKYGDWKADVICFCEGYFMKDNPYFEWLPLNPAKGEILSGSIKGYHVKSIVNQGKWVIPLGNEKVKIGATYTWDKLDFESTEEGEEMLIEAADKMLKEKFIVEGRQAGVRPATFDRRPLVGRHPGFGNIYLLNGLGTKGVSLAPFFARQLAEKIVNNQQISLEANIERFYSLYSKFKKREKKNDKI